MPADEWEGVPMDPSPDVNVAIIDPDDDDEDDEE